MPDLADIFLDVASPDYRRFFGLSQAVSEGREYVASPAAVLHRGWMEDVLLTATLLCDQWVIVPPAFVIECPILAEVVARYRELFRDSLIRTPLRDENMWKTLEKKRSEYDRVEFPHIFEPSAELVVVTIAEGGIQRHSRVGSGMVATVASLEGNVGPADGPASWLAADARAIVRAFERTVREGDAVTPANVLKRCRKVTSDLSRRVFSLAQYSYSTLYVKEYEARILTDVPGIRHHFGVERSCKSISFRWFWRFMQRLGLDRSTLRLAGAEGVMYLRASPAFVAARAAFMKSFGTYSAGDGADFYGLERQVLRREIDRLRLRQSAAACEPDGGTPDGAVKMIYQLCMLWGEGGVGGAFLTSRGAGRSAANRTIVIEHVETLMNSISVSLGNGTVISGDFVVANSIKNSFRRAETSVAPDAVKSTVQQLVAEVGKLVSHLDSEAAAKAADDVEALTKEALRPKPREEWWQLSVKGLRDAATAVKEVGTPVLQMVEKLVPLLTAAST